MKSRIYELGLLVLVLVSGCADDNMSPEEKEVVTNTGEFFESYYETPKNSVDAAIAEISVVTEPNAEVQSKCGSQWGCDIQHTLYIGADAAHCETVSHETGHSIAFVEAQRLGITDDPWDAKHERYGIWGGKEWFYFFPYAVCQ